MSGRLDPAPVVAENSKVTLNLNVNSCVANAHIVTGLPQRKGVNPNACQIYTEIKYVKDVSCVGHLCSVNLVTNAQHAVIDPPARMQSNRQKIKTHCQSRKYMRFHLQGRSYQFKALPFGLSTAPMEFTVVAKEVKLMALQKGIRIHQYLDDWLVRASTHDTCLSIHKSW